MGPVRRLLGLAIGVLIVAAQAGCGGGAASSSGAVSGALTVAATTAEAPLTTVPKRSKVAFPAKTGTDVVRLATLRPVGRVSYDVTVGNGTSYTLDVASDDHHALLHQKQASGEVWIGLDVNRGAVQFMCTAQAGGGPTCQAGDKSGNAAKTAAAIARILGNSFIHATFDPVAASAGPDVGVGPDTQIGLDVSCLAASAPEDLRLCATRQGYITQLSAGPTSILATTVEPVISQSELDPPVAVK
jgi:hypothetical protein